MYRKKTLDRSAATVGALQVADGLCNQEVAARLFLSHKTVEVHLSHI